MVFQVKIEPPKIPPEIKRRVPARIMQKEMLRAANEGAIILTRVMARVSPQGATGLLRNSWLAGIQRARIVGNSAIAGASSPAIPAVIWDEGTKNHPFPPVPATGEPALAMWIRRKLGDGAFVDDPETGRRPADLQNLQDIKKIAFKIGAAIKSRGLPNPRNPRNRSKGLFTRAARAVAPEITASQQRMIARIIARFGD